MIHKFEIAGCKIVLDVNSGAVHVFDAVAWEVIDDFTTLTKQEITAKYSAKYPLHEIEDVLTEIAELKGEGTLFANDAYQVPARDKVEPVVKSICLNVSHDCNMRCRYCFAGSGHFGGQRTLMSYEIGCQAIEFLLNNSAGRRHCELDFFGGEPLMNLGVVEKLVSYGKIAAAKKNKEIKFTLTTNALLLNEKATEFLNRENISVVLSLDGRPAVNDAMRTMAGTGGGSYNFIEPNISAFVASRNNENYFVRGTYTSENLDFSEDVIHLADLGYKYISVEPVVGSPEAEWSLKEADLPGLFREYESLVREYLNRYRQDRPFEFFHFNLDLNNGPCLPKRLSGCGAGHEYLAVTPEGELYPCHQFIGREDFKVGNVLGGIERIDIVNRFREANIYRKEKCSGCWAKFHCGGGCHANAELANGTITDPYHIGCELEKKRLECAIYTQVIKAGYNEI